MDNYSKELTIGIKTFIRKKSLWTLLSSIEKFYPELPVIVVDDSPIKYKKSTLKKYPKLNILYIDAPFDIGLSKGRNLILNNVTTKYFLLCDDDYELTSKTNLYENLKIIEENKIDILGGEIQECFRLNSLWSIIRLIRNCLIKQREDLSDDNRIFTRSKIIDNTLVHTRVNHFSSKLINDVFIVANFFLARTERLKSIGGWQPESLKLYEHGLFYINAYLSGLKVSFSFSLFTKSVRYMPVFYLFFRLRPRKKYDKLSNSYTKEVLNNYQISSVKILGLKGDILKYQKF